MRQGQASVRLLHEVLESLAMMKPNHELSLHQLLDIMPAVTLREAIFVVVTTRPMQLAEEAAKSERLRNATGRGLSNRLILLDVSRGELDGLVEFDQRKSPIADQVRQDSPKLQQASESLETASGPLR